jgi:short-subunit dehydrogenase
MNIFITGGANGIGKRTAVELLDRGHSVKVMDKDEEALEGLDQGIETFHGDVRKQSDLEDAMKRFEVEILINCAGFQERGAVEDLEIGSFQEHIDTNYLGTVKAVKEAMPALRRNNGRIINISSVAGLTGALFLSAYCASKYAVEGFSDSLRMELDDSEIDVVIVEPGPIQTGFNDSGIEKLREFIPGSRYSEEYKERLYRERDRVDIQKAADKVVKAVETDNPKTRYTVTKEAYMVRKLKRFMPDKWWDKVLLDSY